MPISDSRRSDRRHAGADRRRQGFTLIEILVVLFLIGVMAGVVVVALPLFTTGRDFDEETRRMELLLEMLRSQAVLDSVEYGFVPTPEGYRFVRYDDSEQGWQTLEEAPFQPRKIAPTVTFRLTVESGPLSGSSSPARTSVLILSSGEMTPFSMTFGSKRDQRVRTLAADAYGELTWLESE